MFKICKTYKSYKFLLYTYYNSNNPLVFLTPSADSANFAFSASVKLISTIFSIPLAPNTQGTPIAKSFNPNSPANRAEHGNIF